jgi:hypothetical protein
VLPSILFQGWLNIVMSVYKEGFLPYQRIVK